MRKNTPHNIVIGVNNHKKIHNTKNRHTKKIINILQIK